MNLKALKDKINGLVDQIQAAVEAEDFEKACQLKTEHENAMQQYNTLKDLELAHMGNPDGGVPTPKPIDDESKKFFNALRHSFKNLMQSDVDENGGYTVPEDVQTKINHYKEVHSTLRNLVTVENVTTEKGTRVYQKKGKRRGFRQVQENGILLAMDEPAFEQTDYAVKDYGGYLPITNKLLQDSDAALEAVIVAWIGEKSVATDNENILAVIRDVANVVEINTIDDIQKHALVTVGSAYDVSIVTNDSGLLFISQLKDANGRSLVQPNPADPTTPCIYVGAKAYPIVNFPDNDMPNYGLQQNAETGAIINAGVPPIFIGDLKAAVILYDRQSTKIFASEHASVTNAEGEILYNAFQQRGKLFRADVRNDVEMIDRGAFVYGHLVEKETTEGNH